ncbi:MAG: PadR family transcriptional regulator [Candidatus Thorarchaeota archaeon]|nr:PadR family transcriptional regulator [Candidatus Thorarchaeota archaeon]
MSMGPSGKLQEIVALFISKGATSESKAMTLKELGTPRLFKVFLNSPLGPKLPFVEVGDKYYLSEERAAEIEQLGGMFSFAPFQGWVKHTSKVPRGYLRYQVLQLLHQRPMSGSELASCIEEESSGNWRPSPGSLYPLLNSMSDSGILERLPVDQGVKRYRMTDLGQALLDEEFAIAEQMREKLRSGPFPIPPFMDLPEEFNFLREAMKSIFDSIAILFLELKENPDSGMINEMEKITKSAARKLEKLVEQVDPD